MNIVCSALFMKHADCPTKRHGSVASMAWRYTDQVVDTRRSRDGDMERWCRHGGLKKYGGSGGFNELFRVHGNI